MTKKEREFLYGKYGGKCAYCGCDLPKRWHADHIEPIRRNVDGTMEHPERHGVMDNYNPSCPSCNIIKKQHTLEQFRDLISGFIKSLNNYSVQYKFAKKYGLIKETEEKVVFYFEKYNKIK